MSLTEVWMRFFPMQKISKRLWIGSTRKGFLINPKMIGPTTSGSRQHEDVSSWVVLAFKRSLFGRLLILAWMSILCVLIPKIRMVLPEN